MTRPMLPLLVMLAALVLLLPALAGCIGSAPDDLAEQGLPDEAADGDGGGPSDGDAAGAGGPGPLTYASNATVRETVWANGTFAAQDTTVAGGWLTGTWIERTEVTDQVPAGVPTTLRVNLTWEADALAAQGVWELGAWIETDEVDWHVYDETREPGRFELSLVGTRAEDGTVAVVVRGDRPHARADPEVDYTLQVDLRADPTRLAAGMPVEADLEPGDELTVRARGGVAAALRIYDPALAFVADVRAEPEAAFTVPADRPAGPYLLIPAATGADATVVRANGSATVRSPDLEFELRVGEWRTYPGRGEETWSFEIEDHPLAVGIVARDTDDPDDAVLGTTLGGFDGTLAFPDGDAVSGTWQCGFCITGGQVGVVVSPFGDVRIVPGTYRGTISSDASVGFQYAEARLYAER